VVKAHQARNPRPPMPCDSLDSDSEELQLAIAAAATEAHEHDRQQDSPVAEPAQNPILTESEDDFEG
jgi:hypothetical protein